MAMAAVVIGLATVVRDLGAGPAIVREATLTASFVASQLVVAATFGVVLAVLIIVIAPFASAVFGEPDLTPILSVLALGFVVGGLGVVPQALLERSLAFRPIAVAEILAGALALVVALGAALAGLGAMALAIQAVVQTTVAVIVLALAARWRPTAAPSVADVRTGLRFGTPLAGFATLNYLVRNADNALIGAVLGAGPLGFYSVAYRLMLLPVQVVNSVGNRVLLPVLAHRTDLDSRRATYLTAVGVTALVGFPIAAGLAGAAEQVIRVLLGPGWEQSVPVLRLLALVALAQVIGATVGPLFVATGRTDRLFAWGLLSSLITVGSFVDRASVRHNRCGCGLRSGVALAACAFTRGRAAAHRHRDRGRPTTCGAGPCGGRVWRSGRVWAGIGLCRPLAGARAGPAGGGTDRRVRRRAVDHGPLIDPYDPGRRPPRRPFMSRSVAHLVREAGLLTEPFIARRVQVPVEGFVTEAWCEQGSPPEGVTAVRVPSRLIRPGTMAARVFHHVPQLGVWQRRAYRELATTRKPALIHAHYLTTGYLGSNTRSAMVIGAYGFDVSVMARRPLWRRAFRALARQGPVVLVEGPHMRETVIGLGFGPEQVRIVRIAVGHEYVAFAPTEPPDDRPLEILAAGRFVEKKGLGLAIRAFAAPPVRAFWRDAADRRLGPTQRRTPADGGHIGDMLTASSSWGHCPVPSTSPASRARTCCLPLPSQRATETPRAARPRRSSMRKQSGPSSWHRRTPTFRSSWPTALRASSLPRETSWDSSMRWSVHWPTAGGGRTLQWRHVPRWWSTTLTRRWRAHFAMPISLRWHDDIADRHSSPDPRLPIPRLAEAAGRRFPDARCASPRGVRSATRCGAGAGRGSPELACGASRASWTGPSGRVARARVGVGRRAGKPYRGVAQHSSPRHRCLATSWRRSVDAEGGGSTYSLAPKWGAAIDEAAQVVLGAPTDTVAWVPTVAPVLFGRDARVRFDALDNWLIHPTLRRQRPRRRQPTPPSCRAQTASSRRAPRPRESSCLATRRDAAAQRRRPRVFAGPVERPADLPAPPIVGYAGKLAERIDDGLVAAAARLAGCPVCVSRPSARPRGGSGHASRAERSPLGRSPVRRPPSLRAVVRCGVDTAPCRRRRDGRRPDQTV